MGLDEASQKLHQLLYQSLLKIDAASESCRTWPSGSRPTDSSPTSPRFRAGVRFHDGREMTADDVAYTFRRFLDPAFVSGAEGRLQRAA